MTAKRKGSGRVTPKGTRNPTPTPPPADKRTAAAGPEHRANLPTHVLHSQGKVSRPTSHNRGNR